MQTSRAIKTTSKSRKGGGVMGAAASREIVVIFN